MSPRVVAVSQPTGCPEVGLALGSLEASPETRPLADLMRSLLAAAGVPVELPPGDKGPLSHAQRVKASLQAQRRALDALHKVEKAQAARQAKIESLQAQIDSVTKEFVKGKEELEICRRESDAAQDEHRRLLDEPESSDTRMDDSELQELEAEDPELQADPAVLAGKRSYLHALLGA